MNLDSSDWNRSDQEARLVLLLALENRHENERILDFARDSGLTPRTLEDGGSQPNGPAIALMEWSAVAEPLALCQRLNDAGVKTLLIVSQHVLVTAEELFSAGAADFVRSPYQTDELLARIRRLNQLLDAPVKPGTRLPGVCIREREPCHVLVDGKDLILRAAERAVLAYLARAAPRYVTQAEIVESVLCSHGDGSSARNQIYEIRRKLSSVGARSAIVTGPRSTGYRLADGVSFIPRSGAPQE